MLSTPQVATRAGITLPIAQKWAKANGVTLLARDYIWTEEDYQKFESRNKKRGPKA